MILGTFIMLLGVGLFLGIIAWGIHTWRKTPAVPIHPDLHLLLPSANPQIEPNRTWWTSGKVKFMLYLAFSTILTVAIGVLYLNWSTSSSTAEEVAASGVRTPHRLIWLLVLAVLVIAITASIKGRLNAEKGSKEEIVSKEKKGGKVSFWLGPADSSGPPMWTLVVLGIVLIHWLIWVLSPDFWWEVLAPWDVFLFLSLSLVFGLLLLSYKTHAIAPRIGAALVILVLLILTLNSWKFFFPEGVGSKVSEKWSELWRKKPSTLVVGPEYSHEIEVPMYKRITIVRVDDGDFAILNQRGGVDTVGTGPDAAWKEIFDLRKVRLKCLENCPAEFEYVFTPRR